MSTRRCGALMAMLLSALACDGPWHLWLGEPASELVLVAQAHNTATALEVAADLARNLPGQRVVIAFPDDQAPVWEFRAHPIAPVI